jgi:allantoinase
MFDKIIKSTNVVTADEVKDAYVLINEGVIVDVTSVRPDTECREFIDAGDKTILPGLVDPHVHINEPGRTEWEGFETATKAALAGGITTLIEMPLNASPVTTTANAFEQKLLAARNKLYVDCGFWGGVIPGNENDLLPMAEKGVFGFKAFLTHSGIDEFPNVTEADLRRAMPVIASTGLPLLVHCELTDTQFNFSNCRSYEAYLASRPKKWEDDAIRLMIRLCEQYRCPVHIVHLSSADSIETIRAAKEKGLPLTVETAPHYLFFNSEDIRDGETSYKCAPPIREKANNEKLWKALEDGIIDFIATDHSPAPPSMKEIVTGDFSKAWGGIASLQWSLPVVWTAARKRNISLQSVVKWLGMKPARLVKMESERGQIAKGFVADIVVADMNKKFTVEECSILHRHKVTPYLHKELYGVVEQVFLKARRVYDINAEPAFPGKEGRILQHK